MLLRRRRRARSAASVRPVSVDPSLTALLDARTNWIRRIESALAPLGLSFTEYSVLRILLDTDSPLSLEQLVTRLSPGETIAPDAAIQCLLAKGMIEPGLARTEVRITPIGVSRQADGARAVDKVSATFAAMIPDADRESLDRIVSRVRRASEWLAAVS
jgi:hypothetical protein